MLQLLNETSGEAARHAGSPYIFAPYNGAAFFAHDGWQPIAQKSLLKTAAKLERLPMSLRLTALMAERPHHTDRPSATVHLLGRS